MNHWMNNWLRGLLNEWHSGYCNHVGAVPAECKGLAAAAAALSTTAYEEARQKVAKFVNAASWREIVYTRNASEAGLGAGWREVLLERLPNLAHKYDWQEEMCRGQAGACALQPWVGANASAAVV